MFFILNFSFAQVMAMLSLVWLIEAMNQITPWFLEAKLTAVVTTEEEDVGNVELGRMANQS